MKPRRYPAPKNLDPAWGPALTLDQLEVLAKFPGKPESAWAGKVLEGFYASLSAPAPTSGILDNYGKIIGVIDEAGITYGSDFGQPIPLEPDDYRFCRRAFDEGYTEVLPMPDLPVGFLSGLSPAVTAAGAPEIPGDVFAETSRDGSPYILNVFALSDTECFLRSHGTWYRSEEFLDRLGHTSPDNCAVPLSGPDAWQAIRQVDLATAGMVDPLVDSLVAAAGTVAPGESFCRGLVPLVARGNAETLRQYWLHGKGALKIRWGVGGDWYRCYRHLKKYMGVRAKGYCFSGDTEFTTRDGVMTFAEAVGTKQFVLTSQIALGHRVTDGPNTDGYWVEARIEPFGEQRLLHVTLKRGGVTKTIRATPEHRWIASPNGRNARRHDLHQVTTENLRPGMVLASLQAEQDTDRFLSPDGIRAGLVFGDGARHSKNRAAIDLWGDKQDLLVHFEGYRKGTQKELSSGVLGTRVYGLPVQYKDAPSFEADKDYLYGWLAGYFAADGSVSSSGGPTLSSADRSALEHAKHVATLLGIATGSIGSRMRSGFGRPETELFHMAFARWSLSPEFFIKRAHRAGFGEGTTKTSGRWIVVSVEDHGEVEPVYCAVVPETEKFVLTEGIAVLNCQNLHQRATGMSTSTHAKLVRGGKG